MYNRTTYKNLLTKSLSHGYLLLLTLDFASIPNFTAMTCTLTATSLLPNSVSSNCVKFPGEPLYSNTQF